MYPHSKCASPQSQQSQRHRYCQRKFRFKDQLVRNESAVHAISIDEVRSTMNCQVCQNSLYDDPVATASEECRVRITNAMLIQKSSASSVEEKSETTRNDMEDGSDGRYNRQRTRRREYQSSTGRVRTKVRGRFTNESK